MMMHTFNPSTQEAGKLAWFMYRDPIFKKIKKTSKQSNWELDVVTYACNPIIERVK